ncbi:MAG: hypothetical protein AB7I30_00910 [Isosphaeraceae bacterium]
MKAWAHDPLARLRFSVLLALLTLGLLSPSVARAGCFNHYVTYRTLQADATARLEALSVDRTAADASRDAPNPRKAPCTGAFCSGNPATPVSANPSIAQRLPDPGVIPGFAPALTRSGGFTFSPEAVSPRPIDRSLAIFHPPRSLPLASIS